MGTPSGLHIICAPAGTDLRGAVERLKKVFTPAQIHHIDIDEELCNSRETKSALSEAGVSKPRDHSGSWPSMYHVTWNLSRSRITKLWQDAVRDSLHKLGDDNGIKLLTGHLVYYGGRRDEFYSVVTAEPFSSPEVVKPSSVLLLIDDVYDMYLRLTEEKQLYAHADRVQNHLDRMRREEGIPTGKGLSKSLASYLCAEWELSVMTHLLAWRHLEIVTAENFALQAGARFLVFGVKQPAVSAATWLTQPSSASVYFSHPVSRPRRLWRTKKRWHPVVRQFNEVVRELAKKELVCIMPTAIDEYRISRPRRTRRDYLARSPSLDGRWPISFPGVPLLYCEPRRAIDMNHSDVLASKEWNPARRRLEKRSSPSMSNTDRTNMGILLRALERQIQFQISSRDHLLVSHTDALLVFRPFFLEGTWSSGVQAEINHWELLAKSDSGKKAIFVHFEEDIRVRARAERHPARVFLEVDGEISDLWFGEYGVARDKTPEVLRAVRTGGSAMLDSGPLPPPRMTKIRDDFPKIDLRARINVLRKELSGVSSAVTEQVAVVVVRGQSELRKSHGIIEKFLKTGTQPEKDWKHLSDIFFSGLNQNFTE